MKKTKTPAKAKVAPARPTPTPIPPKAYTTAVCPACGAKLNLSSETTAFAEIDDEDLFKAILQKVEQGEVEGDICCCDCCEDDNPTIRGIELTPASITITMGANASVERLAEAYRFVFALRDMVYGTDEGSLQINVVMEA
jgi:hypothetical protein